MAPAGPIIFGPADTDAAASDPSGERGHPENPRGRHATEQRTMNRREMLKLAAAAVGIAAVGADPKPAEEKSSCIIGWRFDERGCPIAIYRDSRGRTRELLHPAMDAEAKARIWLERHGGSAHAQEAVKAAFEELSR